MDFEFNPMALGLAVAVELLLAVFLFKVPTWATYPMKSKIIMLCIAPFVFYFVAQMQLNRGG